MKEQVKSKFLHDVGVQSDCRNFLNSEKLIVMGVIWSGMGSILLLAFCSCTYFCLASGYSVRASHRSSFDKEKRSE